MDTNDDPTTTDLQVEQKDGGQTRSSAAYKKHGLHKRTHSQEILSSHAVEEDMLKELKFAKLIIKHPCFLCIAIIVILFIVGYIDSEFFELSAQSDRTFLIEGDKYVDAFDAYILAAQYVADNSDENATDILPQTEVQDWWVYQIYFMIADYKNDFDVNNPSKTDYWILTPDNVETIIKYEDMIYKDHDWKNQFCYVGEDPIDSNWSCRGAVDSAARDIAELYDFNYDNMTTEDIKEYIMDNIDSYFFYFNPGVDTTGQAWIYRTFVKAAAPIGTEWDTVNGTTMHITEYKSAADGFTEQENEYIEWATDYFVDVTVKHNGDLIDGDLEIIAVAFAVYNAYFNVLLNEAMVFLFFAIMIVFIYMSIHLQSVFLSSIALFQILMSFPLAYFLYRIIFQIPHYDTLSSLIIFVLLGVGADDVFVFTDAWLQSVHFVGEFEENPDDDKATKKKKRSEYEISRMSFAYRRAAKAMLVTQMTTFFAFLATATSSVMPISAFGIWAATIVACNYILVITMYPAVLIIHHRYLKKCETACLCCCCRNCCKKKNVVPDLTVNGSNKPPITRQMSVEEQADEYRWFEKYLGTKYAAFVGKYRVYMLLMFGFLFIAGAILGAQMEAQSEDERWFADEHFMQQIIDLTGEFSASAQDNLVQMQLTWGIDGVNRDGTSKFDPEDYGTVVWDDTFDPSSADAQHWLYVTCQEIKYLDMSYSPELVTCPIDDFRLYLTFHGQEFPYEYGNDEINGGEQLTQSEGFAIVWNAFLNDPIFGYRTVANALSYAQFDNTDDRYYVKFYSVYIYSTLVWSDASDVSRNQRSDWDQYIKDISDPDVCPTGVCNSVSNVALRWCWLVTQSAFVKSAIQGILIAMPLAFIILLLSTQNFIVSGFAVLDIIGIMLCELSIMALQGWKFGVSECVAIVIIIGFSVDYVVHLANAYLESQAQGRMERLSFSLLTMGISVVSGAITTGFAGFFLIFPSITFFQKMGILMVSTVCMSIFWAMCFFTAIIAQWGPEGDTGDMKKYYRICRLKCKGEYVKPVKEDKVSTKRQENYAEYNNDDDGHMKPYTYNKSNDLVEMETHISLTS